MSVDTYDAGLHLNLSGAEKLAVYFGRYLKENYDLKDHREDPEYVEEYNEKTALYNTMIEKQKRELEDNK